MKVVSRIYVLVFLMATVFNYPLVLLRISAGNNKRETDFCWFSLNPSYLRKVSNEKEFSWSAVLRPKSHFCVWKWDGKEETISNGCPWPAVRARVRRRTSRPCAHYPRPTEPQLHLCFQVGRWSAERRGEALLLPLPPILVQEEW